MNEAIADRITTLIDREGAKLPLAEWVKLLQEVRSQVQSRIDAAREDQARAKR